MFPGNENMITGERGEPAARPRYSFTSCSAVARDLLLDLNQDRLLGGGGGGGGTVALPIARAHVHGDERSCAA